jgi:hypothetical protein
VKARAALVIVLLGAACTRAPAPTAQAPVPGAQAPLPVARAPIPAAQTPACRHGAPATCDASAPDYDHDVAPVLAQRCLGCHANGGVAAEDHDFSHLEGVRAERLQIIDEVSSCAMPPRAPLPERDADVLLRWAVCARPPG